MDMRPTLAHCAAISSDKIGATDGIDLWPILSRETSRINRPLPLLHFSFDEPAVLECASMTFQKGRRRKIFKLWRYRSSPHKPMSVFLFDITNDPGEEKDIALEYPDLVDTLTQQMRAVARSFEPGQIVSDLLP